MNRQGFIGGSDLYNIMQGNWHDLWLIKTGRKQPEDLSHIFRVQLGAFTEQFNIDWFCQDTGHTIEQTQVEVQRVISGIPFKGTIDAIAHSDEGKQTILECKHTSSMKSLNDMLDAYMPQIQLYMTLSHIDKAYLSVIFGNDIGYCSVDYSESWFKPVIKRCQEFWKCVTTDTEPSHDIDTWKIDWSSVAINNLKARDASSDNHFVAMAHEYISTVDSAKANESAKKELRSLIRDDEREVFCDLLAVRRDKRGACRIVVNKEA